jgi:molybdate transport system substrate-binding protein
MSTTGKFRRAAAGALAVLFMGAGIMSNAQTPEAPLRVYAAGSLRGPLTEIARAYETETGRRIELTFGASGLLRERIEKGEPAQVFASADTQHPQTLANKGDAWQKPALFTRNKLCALAPEGSKATSANLLDFMLDAGIRLGTSTPRADPSGDYTWELFRKAEAIRPGAYTQLDAKALKLVGASDSPQPPEGRNAYAWLISEKKADLFLTYCTNAVAAQKEVASARVIDIPDALQVAAAYGLTARAGDAEAGRFAQHMLAGAAQATLAKFGFAPP